MKRKRCKKILPEQLPIGCRRGRQRGQNPVAGTPRSALPAKGGRLDVFVPPRHRNVAELVRGAMLSLVLLAASCLCCTARLGAAESVEAAQQPSGLAEVVVGAYVNNVQALTLREHTYEMDIYIWFRWRDEELAPAETVEMVNPNELWGHATDRLYESPVRLPGGELYQVLRIQGRFSRKFFFNNFPFDRQELVVEFEDSVHETNRLIYVPDHNSVAVNPSLTLPGFRVAPARLVVTNFTYPTTFGDTRRSEPHAYSRVRVSLPISRPLVPSLLKMLLPVLCVGLGASLMLLLKATYIDARLGIGITSLLTVVAIQLAANETMPSVDYLVLMDKIHLAAYFYVLTGLGVVLRTAKQIEAGQIEAAQVFQRRCYYAASLVFLAIVAALVSVATIRG